MEKVNKSLLVLTLFLSCCFILTLVILLLSTSENTNHHDKIPRKFLDEDYLSSKYVKQYYPEFENCTVEYDDDLESDCSSCRIVPGVCRIVPGVNVYCNEGLENKGDLSEHISGKNPSFELEFVNGLTLSDLKKQEKEEWMNR